MYDCHKEKEVGAWKKSLTVPFKVFAQKKSELIGKNLRSNAYEVTQVE